MPAVGEEEDYVVVCLHDSVMVSHDDIIAAHDCTDGRAFGQLNLLHPLSNYARAALVAMDHCLEGFRGPTPERMHANDVATADVSEQRANRDRLRRDCDVDDA